MKESAGVLCISIGGREMELRDIQQWVGGGG